MINSIKLFNSFYACAAMSDSKPNNSTFWQGLVAWLCVTAEPTPSRWTTVGPSGWDVDKKTQDEAIHQQL